MKIEFEQYKDKHEIVKVVGDDGVEIEVRTHLPWEEKVKMAEEISGNSLAIHDDAMAYHAPNMKAVEILAILKYYTDVETEDVTPEQAADFVINNGLYDKIDDVIFADLSYVNNLTWRMMTAVIETLKDDGSLRKAIRTSFGFLFNGEDISQSLAKAEAVKDSVYEMIDAWKKAEKEKDKELNDGTLAMGGTILNFAKRE